MVLRYSYIVLSHGFKLHLLALSCSRTDWAAISAAENGSKGSRCSESGASRTSSDMSNVLHSELEGQSFYALSNFAGFRDCNAVNPVKSVTLSVLAIPCWLPSQHVWNSGDAPQISIWESEDYATEEPNAESLQNLNSCPFQRDCKKRWVNSLGNVWHYGIAPLFPSPSSFIQFPCFPINQQKILWLCVLCVDLQVAMQSKAGAFSAHLYVSLKHVHREHFSSYSCRFFGSERTLYASEPSHVSEVRPNKRQLMRCISDFWRHLIALALCIWQKQIA